MAFQKEPNESDKREYIISVVSQLFAERGFASVSIRDICEKAGVTPPTVYYYFGNKNRLYQEVIFRTLSLKDFRESMIETLEKQTDPAGALVAFIRHYLAAFPRGFFNPGMFLQTSTRVSMISTERVKNEFHTINEHAAKIIQEGVLKGIFEAVDIEKATEFLMNLLMAYVMGEEHFYQTHDPDETATFISRLVLNGLRCRTSS